MAGSNVRTALHGKAIINCDNLEDILNLEIPVILADCVPGGFKHPFALLTHIPKSFSSKMTLEVAPKGLDIATANV